jgi:single-strand DNA-binding protein
VGYLGADPELRYTSSGQPVCNMRLATSRRWKDRDGNLKEDTCWTRITTWGKHGENCKERFHKGSQVYVEGRLKRSKYTDKQGQERYSTEVVSYQVQGLDRRPDGDSLPAVMDGPSAELPASTEEMPF